MVEPVYPLRSLQADLEEPDEVCWEMKNHEAEN
jgi:hypothetical protein